MGSIVDAGNLKFWENYPKVVLKRNIIQLESLENVDFSTPPFLVVLKTLISPFSEPFLLYEEVKKIICPFFSKYVIVDFFHFLANEGPSGTDFGGAKIGDTPLPQGG